MNHSQGGITGVYDQFDYLQERRDALEKPAREIMRIVGKKQALAKVVKLRTAVA